MTSLAPDRAERGGVSLSAAPMEQQLEEYRRELTGYSYRMLGSIFDAEDAVQEAMVRAWRSMDGFDGRSSLRTWLYRITTNVCLDLLASRQRRALPIDLGPSSAPVAGSLGEPLPEITWLEPAPDDRVLPERGDPADIAVARDSIRLAFVSALQRLPARQRAVLILREVLRWKADEVAELLDSSVASVNSALQRARATLAATKEAEGSTDPIDDEQRALLARYVDAFERYDIPALVQLLRDDAVASMPPYQFWLNGAEDIGRWHLGPGIACKDGRLVPVNASGQPGFAAYKRTEPGGRLEPFSIQVLEVSDGRIAGITYFLGGALFPVFGLPAFLEDEPVRGAAEQVE